MDKSLIVDNIDNDLIIYNEKNDIDLSDDDFTPDEDEKSIDILEEVNEKLKTINKIKIDRDYFYKMMNYNYLDKTSQNIFIRNIITFKFNNEITFYALDLQFCIYDLFIDKTFSNTLSWINYIEENFEK
jgi:hypothetical protein